MVVTGAGLPGAQETGKASWIEVRQIANQADLATARARCGLGIGELSALILATEVSADLVLLDDLAARKLALAEGLKVQGTIGILEACFVRGYITDLRQSYRDLLDKGIYLNRAFLDTRLRKLNLRSLE